MFSLAGSTFYQTGQYGAANRLNLTVSNNGQETGSLGIIVSSLCRFSYSSHGADTWKARI